MNKEKVIVITGPTGIGKTEISLELCKIYDGEIINADASQFKKKLNVGTAKIDLAYTNVKHHLIDIIDYDQFFSINDYQKITRKLITELTNNHKLPFIIGGSGLYINSVLYDYNLDSPKRNENLLSKYDNLNDDELHKVLENVDHESSLKIHKNNRRRVLRAIELALSGNLISENIQGNQMVYNPLIICLDTDREVLYKRINERVVYMIENGWINECENLMKYDNYKLIKDIGYQEVFSYLCNEITKEKMIEVISKKTRNYAKRQLTWMRNKMNCQFVNMNYCDINQTIDEIKQHINNYLKK